MTAIQVQSSKNPQPSLYVSFELGWSQWKLAFGTCPGDPARLRTIGARQLDRLQEEFAKAKKRLGLAEDAPIFSCYEAGRDGFWLHRWLTAQGVQNVVVDSSSIEMPRRGRRAKNDRLDAAKLLSMLLRYRGGEEKLWRVVHVPSVEDDDRRQLHRDLLELKAERTQHGNRMQGLLAALGLAVEVGRKFLEQLAELRTWDGQAVPAGLRERLQREFARWQFVDRQIKKMQRGHSLFQIKKRSFPFFCLRPMRSPSHTATQSLQLRFRVRVLDRHQPVVAPRHRTRIKKRKLHRLRLIPQA